MTTRIDAANARAAEGEAAWTAGDYAAAARDFTLAAEQLEALWHEMHGHRGASPDAQNMRRRAREAIQRRDADVCPDCGTPEHIVDAMNASMLKRGGLLMITIYAVFRATPKKGDVALALFTDARNAHNFASQYRGSIVDEWQVSNADFMAHEGYADDEA